MIPRKPPSLLFRLVIPITFLFVFTCFVVLTHDLLGDQSSNFAKLLQKYGTKVLAVEAAAAVVLTVVAMAADRIRTLREPNAERAENADALAETQAPPRPADDTKEEHDSAAG